MIPPKHSSIDRTYGHGRRPVVFRVFIAALCLTLVGAGALSLAGPSVLAQETAAETAQVGPAEVPAEEKIISAETVFFGCAFGASLGALVTRFPPLVGWTMWAGALPAFTALAVTAGLGCAAGLFFNVVLSTVDWMVSGF